MNPSLIKFSEVPETDSSDIGTDQCEQELILPSPISWDVLLSPVDMADNLLGDRFLERGQGLILFGPAGCGKSVAGLQAVAEWSAGLAGLHIPPPRPLKIVVIQTEDSLNDTRESLAGILSTFSAGMLSLVKSNLIILPSVRGGTGVDLRRYMKSAIRIHNPDLLHVNPLLAFCSGDPTRDLGGLLYQDIDPIIKEHRTGFVGIHHTPKTNGKDTTRYGAHDHQYLAAGDARVANWPRAMIQMEPVAGGVYRFRAAKRGHRAGWTDGGRTTIERYFRHHREKVRWMDATLEEARESAAVETYRTITSILPSPDQTGISRDRVRYLAKTKLQVGRDKADTWLKLAIEDETVERVIETSGKREVALFRLKGVADVS